MTIRNAPAEPRPPYDGIIVQTPATCGGKPRIEGSRISVALLVPYFKNGETAEKIADRYPHLTVQQVEAAAAYYGDHREEIDASIAESERFVEQLRRKTQGPLTEKLKENPYLLEQRLAINARESGRRE